MIIRSIDQIISGRGLHEIAPGATLREACDALKSAKAGALAVMDDGELAGILSGRDIIHRGVCEHRSIAATSVADVMTPNPQTIDASASLADAMSTMIEGGFRHLPVVRAGKVTSMLSMRDIPTEYRLMTERFLEAQTGPQILEGRASLAH